MNKHLIPKAEFAALIESAGANRASGEAQTKVWFTLAARILRGWDGLSYSFLDALTPGQSALVYSAKFYRGVKGQDLLSVLASESLPSHTLTAFEILKAQEYLLLLREIEGIFPSKKFPKYAEDIMSAVRKQPSDYFDKMGDKFVTGKGMKRPLHDYVFAYVTGHPKDFCTA